MTVHGVWDKKDDGRLTGNDLLHLVDAARHYVECVVMRNVKPDELLIKRLEDFDRAIRHANATRERMSRLALAEFRDHGS